MSHEFLPHTADVRMKVAAGTLQELFSEAVSGMAEFLGGKGHGEQVWKEVSVEASSLTDLLVDALSEALAQSHIEKAVFPKVTFSEFSPTRVSAKLEGRRVKSFDEDIKAVTYHEAEILKSSTGYEVTVVFDI